MKRYIRSATTTANANAKMIAEAVFGKWYSDDYRVKIFKQVSGYAVKYYADGPGYAEDILDQMIEAAKRLNIPVIRSSVKDGWLQQFGSIHYYVACIVVPAADV